MEKESKEGKKKKTRFTIGLIANAVCPKGSAQVFFWDDKAPGLGLRVTAAGTKSFVYQGRLHGRTIRTTIGSIKVWPLDSYTVRDEKTGEKIERLGARQKARDLQCQVGNGIDPRDAEAEKNAAAEAARIEAKRKDVTLSEAWTVYVEARRRKWSDLNYRDHVELANPGGQVKKRGKGLTEPGPLAPLLSLRLYSLTEEKVTDWMAAEAIKRPTRARLAFNLMRIFAKWCSSKAEYKGLIDEHAFDTRIARDVLPSKQTKKDVIEKEQLAAWFEAVQQLGNSVMTTYLIGLLLTGARREELTRLKWYDVDFEWNRLTIRDKASSKGGEEGTRTIPLTPYFASLLRELKRINEIRPNVRQLRRLQKRGEEWEPSPWVFFSKKSSDGKLVAPNRALNRVCEIAGIPPVTLHGLRRSFATLTEWTETPTGIVAQIMGHRPSATAEKHYKVRPLSLLRKWHDPIEAWILEQAGIKFTPAEQVLKVVDAR